MRRASRPGASPPLRRDCANRALRFRVDLCALLSLAFVAALACRSAPSVRVVPVAQTASEALAEAQAWLRARERGDVETAHEHVREAALRALAAAPDWVAPQRMLDDLARDELRGVEALQSHRAALAIAPADAREQYLAGRLEGLDGAERFERAVRLDPSLAWGHHGLAWVAGVRGETRLAVEHARRALARARDPWERSFFTSALARSLVTFHRRDDALRLLEERIRSAETSPADRVRLSAEAVTIGLEARLSRARLESYERGLELLRTGELTESEIEALVRRMRLTGSPEDPDAIQLQVALAPRSSPARDRLRAELMLDAGSSPLALGLLQRALEAQGQLVPSGPLIRAARFAAGEYAVAVELWLADLPASVLDDARLPRDPRLVRVVDAARALGATHGASARAGALAELGEALVDAGWFREARSVAAQLAALDLDRALALESRALAGLGLLEGVRRLVTKVDLENGAGVAGAQGNVERRRERGEGSREARSEALGTPSGVRDLAGLLVHLGPLFARANEFLGGESDPERMGRVLAASPRMNYGPVGELAHPGPWFSKNDGREGLGAEGEEVPGIAAELARIGRFGLFGEVTGGGGPDATILARIGVEHDAGEHFGVRWGGTIVWCEGADLPGRAGRHGAHISAAALHEGYWLDINAVRSERALWTALRHDFAGAQAGARIDRVLAVRGLRVELPLDDRGDGGDERGARERTRIGALLGEAQRVRLATLRDRARDGEALGDIAIEELVDVTATHEEGHLCDRTRYLPVSRKLPKLLLFLLDCGFSPSKIGETLEYRAQLVCIAESADPRIGLAQVLDAAEQGPSGLTPHAAGYTTLLADLLDVFVDELASDPSAFPEIDPGYTLAHQLHRLPPEKVRRLALELARRKRLN